MTMTMVEESVQPSVGTEVQTSVELSVDTTLGRAAERPAGAGIGCEYSVHLATELEDGRTTTRDLTVWAVAPDLDAVECHGHMLGYIQRAGRVFVSLVGERRDRAEECGQFLGWDRAARRLSTLCPNV